MNKWEKYIKEWEALGYTPLHVDRILDIYRIITEMDKTLQKHLEEYDEHNN
jgi:hypothetical protein